MKNLRIKKGNWYYRLMVWTGTHQKEIIPLKTKSKADAIRRVYLTGNIFQVAMEMDHKNVTTTQHYLRFRIDMIKAGFPVLAVIIEEMENL